MMIKSLLLAGFLFVSALAEVSQPSVLKPAMAILELQSNFDYSLTRKEFRVYYSGLGEAFTTSASTASIKIYKKEDSQETLLHTFTFNDKDTKKVFHLALDNASDGKYEVEVCAGAVCSERNPALTEMKTVNDMKITCKRVDAQGADLVGPDAIFEEKFVGPEQSDWIQKDDFQQIEAQVNKALRDANKADDYKTDFSNLGLTANPTYKHNAEKETGTFYAGLRFNIARYRKLFDTKLRVRSSTDNTYAHEFCERKYLLSAHAHLVNKNTKVVEHRFKTTLFLSEGGKRMYVLAPSPDKVHVEMTHEDVKIPKGEYNLWITFCATEKDAVDSTFCVDPIIETDFKVAYE